MVNNFVSQTRKPEGFLGKMMLGGMNSGHAKLADWGFMHLPEMTPGRAVDHSAGEEITTSGYAPHAMKPADIVGRAAFLRRYGTKEPKANFMKDFC